MSTKTELSAGEIHPDELTDVEMVGFGQPDDSDE